MSRKRRPQPRLRTETPPQPITDPVLLQRFHFQIWTQCRFALASWDALNQRLAIMEAMRGGAPTGAYAAVRDLPRDEMVARATEIAMEGPVLVWQHAQAFLAATANLSKALWGQEGKSARERAPLRKALNIANSSPLKPTSMRNNFDHFDERLMDWWRTSENHNYVDLSFGDVSKAIQGIPASEMFRSYNPATGDLEFWGKRYNLPLIVAEIERIAPLAIREATETVQRRTSGSGQ